MPRIATLKGETNYGGGKRLVLFDRRGVNFFTTSLPSGIIVPSAIVTSPNYPGIEFRFTPATLEYEEKPSKIGGVTIYNTELSGLIPKDRSDITDLIISMSHQRFVGFYEDNNRQVKIIGTPDAPAKLELVSIKHKSVITDRNEYALQLVRSGDKPALSYTNTQQPGIGIGYMIIGSTFIVQ
jgi:hypothetical protein